MKSILWRLSTFVTAGLLLTTTARANVYATNLKLNGARSPVTGIPPLTNSITYILNEPATLGTTVNILSGTNIVRTISLGAGTNGTWLGSNYVIWDSSDNNSNAVPTGNYVISVTPAAIGYSNWTQISRDTNTGNFALQPRGIAVDNNSNSIYYGRIFVGNAQGADIAVAPATTPGSNDTILKLNADCSFSDDGPYGDGGYVMFDTGSADLPEKLRLGDDDRLYMNDFSSYGQIVAFNTLLTTNEVVLSPNNYSGNSAFFNNFGNFGWFSFDVTSANTDDGLIWLGDGDTNGAGIWNWHMTNGIADPTDTSGNLAIPLGGGLTSISGGLIVDTNLDIFIGQYLTDTGDTNPCCMVFTNWNSGSVFTNGTPTTNGLAWSDTNILGVYDVSIDSRQKPKYVACSLNGGPTSNGVRILNALTGATVTNLDSTNQYYVVAWDNVGNLYAGTGSAHRLRVFSPPDGTNQATTLAIVKVEPEILRITNNRTTVVIEFLASRSDTIADFSLIGAPAITGPFQTVTGTVASLGNGLFTVTAATPSVDTFYQILRNTTQ